MREIFAMLNNSGFCQLRKKKLSKNSGAEISQDRGSQWRKF